MTKPVVFGNIGNFNTGCWYGRDGQPISWATFLTHNGKEGIIYQDHARGITKAIPMPGVAGHTYYCGEKKEAVVYGEIGDRYVRDCEAIGIYHDAFDNWCGFAHEFHKLDKGTIVKLTPKN